MLVGLATAALASVVAMALVAREEQQFRLLVESGARRVRSEIRAGLNARTYALSILVSEWEDRFLPLREGWESDVRLALSQSPGLESIAWVDDSGELSWIYPADAAVPALDVDALRAEGTALRRSVVRGPFDAGDGQPRLCIVAPLREGEERGGWLAASYRSQELLSDILGSIDTSHAVSVSVGGVELFREGAAAPGPEGPPAWKITDFVVPGGLEFQIAVEPSSEMVSASRSPLPSVTRAGGFALSVLIALSLGLRNLASMRARALEAEIDERVRAEAEVRRLAAELEVRVEQRTAELSRSNEGLQQFASFLSHELRQPLGAQRIWLELLESESGADLSEKGRAQLASLRRSVQTMSDLITAQLELSSSRAASEPPRDRVALESVVADACTGLAAELEVVGAKLQVGELPTVFGDAGQLRQLFRNLLENALKYRRDGVAPEIAVSCQRLAAGEGGGVEIRVADNGCGFPPEDAERIFEPRQRAACNGAEGQGLGLAICRSIVVHHGGRLWAEGRPGEGARFRISLPPGRLASAPELPLPSHDRG